MEAVVNVMSKVRTIFWPKVVLFGDSITQFSFQTNGWGSEIADKLVRKCDVMNRGLSGYNTRWAKMVLPQLINDSSPDSNIVAVTIFFGANDCSLPEYNTQQHVPLLEYAENLRDMVAYLSTVGVSTDKVILITPPPLHEPDWEKECILKGCPLNRLNAVTGQYADACVQIARQHGVEAIGTIFSAAQSSISVKIGCPLNRLNAVTGQYADACVQIARQHGVEVLDLWTLMQKDGQDFPMYLSDGLHLSDKGNQFVAQNLWTLLEKRVETLPMILPYWGDVDNKNPEHILMSHRSNDK